MARRAGVRAMLRPLVAVNAVLIGITLTAVAYTASELRATPEGTGAAVPRMTAAVPAMSITEPAVASPPGAYAAVAGRNLFSPSRSEVASDTVGASAASSLPKPHLYGVVLREGKSVAYMEDPATKRVTGYRPGDTIAGATVREISADRVVIARADAQLEVRLNDPSKPRPAAPPASTAGPSVTRATGEPVVPVSGPPGSPPGVAVGAGESPPSMAQAPPRPPRRMPFRFNPRSQ
jgi:hypothetical protein